MRDSYSFSSGESPAFLASSSALSVLASSSTCPNSTSCGCSAQMGNGNSKENGPETPGLIGKLGGIPRAAAITEGRRAKGGQPKLPPNAIKSQAEDWAFIEVKS